ncbi:MAG TPA: glycosyltransferase family 25 protein [Gemmatimonadales bacterium]
MSPKTLVLVISLADAPDRRAGFSERARATTLPWQFFDAHRALGAGLTYRSDEAVIAKGRPLTPGELGCYSSHYQAWQALLDSPAAQMIVLEDDTIVDWTFLEKLATRDFPALGVSYLRLYAKRPSAFRMHGEAIEARRFLVEYASYVHGTQGYVISRVGAERFVRHCRQVRRPVDNELDRAWEHGVPCLALFPFPLTEISTASTIGAARWERPEIPARLRGARFRMRMVERARRTRWWLRVMTRLHSPAPGLGPG